MADLTVTDTTTVAAALRRLADFADANPDLAGRMGTSLVKPMIYAQTRDMLGQFVRAGLAAGATITKTFDENWANVHLNFGGITVEVYTTRGEVCERVVVGTETVEEEAPDPEAVAALPKVKVAKTIEKVRWVCAPILAEVPDGVS